MPPASNDARHRWLVPAAITRDAIEGLSLAPGVAAFVVKATSVMIERSRPTRRA